jgi:hypothetical protein
MSVKKLPSYFVAVVDCSLPATTQNCVAKLDRFRRKILKNSHSIFYDFKFSIAFFFARQRYAALMSRCDNAMCIECRARWKIIVDQDINGLCARSHSNALCVTQNEMAGKPTGVLSTACFGKKMYITNRRRSVYTKNKTKGDRTKHRAVSRTLAGLVRLPDVHVLDVSGRRRVRRRAGTAALCVGFARPNLPESKSLRIKKKKMAQTLDDICASRFRPGLPRRERRSRWFDRRATGQARERAANGRTAR